MDTKEEHIFNEIRKIQYLTNFGKNHEALNLFSTLERKYANNPTIQFNKAGLLIDNGSDLKEPRIVEEGIKLGEKLLAESRYKKYIAHLNYNLANGYDSLYRLYWDSSKGLKQTLDNEYLQKAKRHYREALKEKDTRSFEDKKQLLTNYANCLSNLGRNLEALYLYDEVLKIEPAFGMALGNYAKTIINFAGISGAYRTAICIDAYGKLESALNDPSLPRYGGIRVKERFKEKLEKIKNWLDTSNVSLRKLPQHKRYSHRGLTDLEKFYLDICSKHKLFLNFHIQDNICEASIVDPVCISIITPVEDNYTFYELSKYVNQIKEDFATARLLFVQSQYERQDFNKINKRTDYVYALDYSMFNLYCGLLKLAFTQAYNILDKLALFINEYFSLGMNTTRTSFMNIWKEKGVSRTRIVDSENFAVYALYDIFLDFESGYYKKIKDIRNAITHRRLVIFDSTCASDLDKDIQKGDIGYETMLSETINLFKLVKSSIIYLVNAVELEERNKRKEGKSSVVPMYADTEQLLPVFRNYKKFRKVLGKKQ